MNIPIVDKRVSEIANLMQLYSENNGLSYAEGIEKAKKLLSERADTHISDNSLIKKPFKL